MARERGDNVGPKSAGKARRSSFLQRTSNALLTSKLENITQASEEERKQQYDDYQPTGDFERDFTFLCHLTGLKLNVTRRMKAPSVVNVSNNDKTKNSESETDISSPTTYVISKNKYEYFKPHLEIDTESVQNKEYVKEIYLRGWKADARIVDIFQKSSQGLARLTVLKMWNAGLSDETLADLGGCLDLLPSLKTLCLDGNCHVTGQKFHIFLEKSDNRNLEHLSLRHCNLNEVGASHLANSLKNNDKLLTLNLSFNKLGDQGAFYLADSLRFNRSLLSLSLSNNELGDESVRSIASSISTFPLTHEEVVKRRRIQQSALVEELTNLSAVSDKVISTIQNSPPPKISKTPKKKDSKVKEKKTKNNWDKLKSASPSKNKRKMVLVNDEPSSLIIEDPLLEKTQFKNGELWIRGNRSLIYLNLSRNNITNVGLESLFAAITYQTEDEKEIKSASPGLMKLSLEKNPFTAEDKYIAILEVLKARYPPNNIEENTPEENK